MAVAMELAPFVEKEAVGAARPGANKKVFVALAAGAAAGAVVASACNGLAGSAQEENTVARALFLNRMFNRSEGAGAQNCYDIDWPTGLCYKGACREGYEWIRHPDGITTIGIFGPGTPLGMCEEPSRSSLMTPITSAISSAWSSLTSGKEECRGWPVTGHMLPGVRVLAEDSRSVAAGDYLSITPEQGLEKCRQMCLSVPTCQSISFRHEKRCTMYALDPDRADISSNITGHEYHNFSRTDKISCFPNEGTGCEIAGQIRGPWLKRYDDGKEVESKTACRLACEKHEKCKSFSYKGEPLAYERKACLLYEKASLKREDVRYTAAGPAGWDDSKLYTSESTYCEKSKKLIEIGSHIVNAGVHLALRTAFAKEEERAQERCQYHGYHQDYLNMTTADQRKPRVTIEQCREMCHDDKKCTYFIYGINSDWATDLCIPMRTEFKKDDITIGAGGFFTEVKGCQAREAEEDYAELLKAREEREDRWAAGSKD